MKTMYASQDGERLSDVFENRQAVYMCGDREPVQVTVEESKKGLHWGWEDVDGLSMIQESYICLHMCFPYGIQREIDAGNGRAVQLLVQKI